MMKKTSASYALAALLVSVLAATGCSTSTSSAPGANGGPQDCVTECEASGGAGTKVCGTDKTSYDGCAWDCDKIPAGVAIFPGACQADGSPAADAPQTPADGEIVCDYIRNGDHWQPVECAKGLETAIEDGSTYVDGAEGSGFISETALGPGRFTSSRSTLPRRSTIAHATAPSRARAKRRAVRPSR